jgi:hydroxymethylpyrimidine/phosphomethylpyrimidine kinase
LDNKQKIADSSSQNNLELSIQNSLKFVYESVKNGRYGTLNPNFNSKPFII